MFQNMAFKEIFVLVGLIMFLAFSSLIAARLISYLFRDIASTIVAVTMIRKMVESRKLVVAHKRHIAPNEIVDRVPVILNKHTSIGTLTYTIPPNDMWVVTVDMPLGLFHYRDLAISIDQAQWLELAPGDEMDNPHFGGIKVEAMVNPRIEDWLRRTVGADA